MAAALSNANSKEMATESYTDKLPTREGWSEPLVLYKNYWFRPQIAKTIMLLKDTFKPRPDDIIIATHPKCGTTWMKALAFAIVNRCRYAFDDHPLLTRHPQHVVPFLEIGVQRGMSYVDTIPSPRLLATHTPLSLLSQSIETRDCRIVYMCREPKDALVSRWHFENKINKGSAITIGDAVSMFCEGFSPYGPFWDHYLEYWRESIARPDKVLFLKYDEMMLEPVKIVRRLAMFLGEPFTEEEENNGVPEAVVKLCSFEKLSSLPVNRSREVVNTDKVNVMGSNVIIENSVFFRKGKLGDWVNHLSEDMGKTLDCIVEEKLRGSGLSFDA